MEMYPSFQMMFGQEVLGFGQQCECQKIIKLQVSYQRCLWTTTVCLLARKNERNVKCLVSSFNNFLFGKIPTSAINKVQRISCVSGLSLGHLMNQKYTCLPGVCSLTDLQKIRIDKVFLKVEGYQMKGTGQRRNWNEKSLFVWKDNLTILMRP